MKQFVVDRKRKVYIMSETAGTTVNCINQTFTLPKYNCDNACNNT